MLELSSKPKEAKPPKEKKVYYSSRGGAGRSKSVGPVARKPAISSAPSRILEVPVPTNKTTSTGRGGSANGRTFVVEEGTFERVMEFETGKILAMKSADAKRRTMGLRGGSAMPDANDKKKEKSPTATQISSQFSDDETSSLSIVTRFKRVPSFNSNIFSREQPPSPASVAPSQSSGGSVYVPQNTNSRPPNGATLAPSSVQASPSRHCPTCQCWRHTTSTQLSLDFLPSPVAISPPPSPFKAIFPGVLLYVPEDPHASGQPPSPTASSVYSYYRDRDSQVLPSSPEGESNPRGARYYRDSVLPPL